MKDMYLGENIIEFVLFLKSSELDIIIHSLSKSVTSPGILLSTSTNGMPTCSDFAGLIFVHSLVIMTAPYTQLTGQGIDTSHGFFRTWSNPPKFY